MRSTIAAVLMTILTLFAVCNGMFRRSKKEKNRSDATTTNFHQTQTENDGSTTSFYQIDATNYLQGVQQLTAEPAYIPTDNNSWSSESQMPWHSNYNISYPKHSEATKKKLSEARKRVHQRQKTENDESTTSFYQIDATNFRHCVQQLTAEPAYIPTDNNSPNVNMLNAGSNTNPQTSIYSNQNISSNTLNKRKSASKKRASSSTTSHNFNQSQSVPFHPNQNQLSMPLHPVQDQSSMQFNLVQDQSSMQFNPVQDQSSMQSNPVQDQSSMQFHPVQDQSSMQFHPVQDQSSMQFNPVQDQSSMQFHPVQDQSSMQFHPNQNQSSMQFNPVQDQSSMQFNPVQDQSSMQFHPVQDQSSMQFHPNQNQSSMPFHPNQNQSSMQFHPNQNQSSMQSHPVQDQSSMQFNPTAEMGNESSFYQLQAPQVAPPQLSNFISDNPGSSSSNGGDVFRQFSRVFGEESNADDGSLYSIVRRTQSKKG